MRSHPVVMGAALAISLLGCTEPQPSTPQTDGAPDVPTDVVTARDVIDAGDTPDATDGGNPGDGAARGDAATDRAVVEETIPVLDGGCLGGPSTLHVATSGQVSHTTNPDIDLLFAIDNSDSAAENRSNLARNLDVLLRELVDPPTIAGTLRYQYPPARSLHVGVISTDLGTPGSTVPSCANGAEGDSEVSAVCNWAETAARWARSS